MSNADRPADSNPAAEPGVDPGTIGPGFESIPAGGLPMGGWSFPKLKILYTQTHAYTTSTLQQNTNNRSTSAITYRVALVFCFCNKWVLF